MSKKQLSKKQILETFGVDVSNISTLSYNINEESDMLVICSRSKIDFDETTKPKETVYGSFSDTYFYYFSKVQTNNE